MDIQLLGPVSLLVDGVEAEVGTPQRRLVLAALAADAGHSVSVGELSRRIWDAAPPTDPRRSLRPHVSGLRRLLAQGAGPRHGASLEHAHGGYTLRIARDRVDVLQFLALTRQAAQAPAGSSRLRELLGRAHSLWRGEALAGLTGEWADATRHSWLIKRVAALVAWAQAEVEAGDATTVIGPLADFVAGEPLEQKAVGALMRALFAAGDGAQAVELFEMTRERLADRLGMSPDPQLSELHVAILRGRVDWQAPRPPAVRPDPAWPHAVGTLPPRADAFQIRAAAGILDGAAQPGRTVVLTHVVAGLGGVGKTQLAADLARRLWDRDALDLLVWASALSRDSVVSAYAQTGTDLAIGPDGEEPERTVARFMSWLARTERRWLIVLDDVTNPADIRDLWPPERPNGRVVVTTRRRDAGLLAGRNLVEIDVFTAREAAGYLERRIPARLADDIPGVADDLGALPLALSHAAAYIADQGLTCTDYRIRFADRRRRLADLFPHPDTLADSSAQTVATTWNLSVEAADALPPAGLARPLLEIAAALQPNGIPEEVFNAQACRAYVAERSGRRPDPADIWDGLRSLHRFHLITHEDGVVRVHALVQRAVREGLGQAQANAVAGAAADALIQTWPAADHDAGHLMRANAMALQDNWQDAIWNAEHGMHPVMLRTIESLGAAVQLTEAIRLCRELSGLAASLLGPVHRDTLTLRNQLATWLGDAGFVAEATEHIEELAADVVSALGAEHPLALKARRTLGYQHGLAGYPARAVAGIEPVLGALLRTLGPDHLEVIYTRSQLAYWCGKSGDVERAVAEYDTLLPQATRVLGPDSRLTLDIRAGLWKWRAEAGDPAGAAAAYQDLVTDAETVLGRDHRDVSLYRHHLATAQARAGHLQEAAATFAQLTVQRLRVFGPHHRDTLATRREHGRVQLRLGNPGAAVEEFEQVVAGMARLLGDTHPDTLRDRQELDLARAEAETR
ncbi:FxSxx-COOH system tetratricopeptide repeat protein [Catellatospora vulcania]|uniref:FxSxx-COOH system tetratricopeptide repeat protein n=1 Tax=Catellatospora vulcania TaxID=1460450 RepID=UPI0012D3CEEC|nr:FxSxx-COOH system tetratricopeptide repeat protein [Catellatospora vulcania]